MWDGYLKLTRQELYEKVWSTPARKLQKELGVSDVMIGKLCKKHGVPKPPPGYWARLRAGLAPRRAPLPKPAKCQNEMIYIRRSPPRPQPKPLDPGVAKRIQQEADPQQRIEVADTLTDPHPLVRATRRALERAAPDTYGLLVPKPGHGGLDLRVSAGTLDRALRIADALIRALKARGCRVEAEAGEHTYAVIGEERVRFRLRERVRVTRRKLTAREEALPFWERPSTTSYTPKGQLAFSFGDYNHSSRTPASCADDEKRPLEAKLNAVVATLLREAERQKQERLEWAERQRQLEAETRRREEERLRRYKEEQRLKELEALASQWHRSQQIHKFLDAYEATLAPEEQSSAQRQWLTWARQCADRLDPLKNSDAIRTSETTF
ncbi:hypothetical protein [Calidithermus chliarophilus]|uniref:hypothetical protein n=1 Tax=Calidithermus chliarophilus TaxID=52023 RepID=UPI000489EF2B|nr:hypothetical protein [Calidithermus chliarophilus]